MDRQYYVYILTNERNGTLYIGVTNNLKRRIFEHEHGLMEGFTKQYGLHRLVHYEVFTIPMNAIEREKQLKEWRRKWKLELIEKENPTWRDLSRDL